MRNVLAVSRGASISDQDAGDMVEQVRTAVSRWPEFANEVELSRSRAAELDRILNDGKPAGG
jgi:serine/threonine-protein kinase HipA